MRTITNVRWNSADEMTLANIVLKAIEVNGNTRGAFQKAARVLGHTTIACSTKWHKELKQDFVNEVKAVKERFSSKQTRLPISLSSEVVQKSIKSPQTNLQTLIKSIKSMENESLKIINSGKGGTDYIVINNEENFGYLVNTENGKVTSCNCPHRHYRNALCKHMIQVAIAKNLEVF